MNTSRERALSTRDGVAPAAARAAVLAMVIATLLWGGTFVLLRDSVRRMDPMALVCGRFGVATLVFALVLAVRRLRPDARALRDGALAGLCAGGGFAFQAVGLVTTSAGSSAFLTYVGTALAALYAWPLLRQRPDAPLLRGLGLALTGTLLLSWGRGGDRVALGLAPGDLWTLLGAALWGLQIVALARGAARTDPLVLAAVQSATIFLTTLPWLPSAWHALRVLDAPGGWRFAYLAVPAAVVAPLLQVRAQRALPAGRIALLFALEPVFALGFALALGGERFDVRWWAGAALILSGVLAVEWRTLSSAPATPRPATP